MGIMNVGGRVLIMKISNAGDNNGKEIPHGRTNKQSILPRSLSRVRNLSIEPELVQLGPNFSSEENNNSQ